MSSTTITELLAGTVHEDFSNILRMIMIRDPLLKWVVWALEKHHGDDEQKFSWEDLAFGGNLATFIADYTTVNKFITLDEASAGLIRVGDHVNLWNHYDSNNVRVTYKASAVDTITYQDDKVTLTVIRGIDTDRALIADGNNTVTYNRSREDNAVPNGGKLRQGTKRTNFIQFFEEGFNLGRQAWNSSRRGNVLGFNLESDAWKRGMFQTALKLAGQIRDAVFNGVSQAPTTTVGAYMEGIESAILASQQVDAVGGAITLSLVNDAVEKIALAGGLTDDSRLVLFVDPENHRALSDSRVSQIVYNDSTQSGDLGSNTERIITSMGGHIITMVTSTYNNYTQAHLVDANQINLVPVEDDTQQPGDIPLPLDVGIGAPPDLAWIVDGSANGQHGVLLAARAMCSLKFMNRDVSHARIFKLGQP